MSPSPDSGIGHVNPPSNLTYLYKQQRNRQSNVDNLQGRGRNSSRYEVGRKDRYGDRVTRIYPREITKSPPARYGNGPVSPSMPGYSSATSPLLSALGGTTNPATQYTSDWAKSLPFFAQQQPATNGVSINGSPPNPQGAMSPSPPNVGSRPLSHPNQYTSFGGRMQRSPKQSPRDRRTSMLSPNGLSPFSNNPPLPHEMQPHFYGVPQIPDLDLNTRNPRYYGINAGDGGYYCGFDTLGEGGDGPSKKAENVLLVGYEGGCDVFKIERGKMDVIGRLEGLRGAVVGAKILPFTGRGDMLRPVRPLIALVIHGPKLVPRKDSSNSDESSGAVTDDDGGSNSPQSRPASSRDNETSVDIQEYQTTVEVYSLRKHEHVSTLYECPPVSLSAPVESPLFEAPPPTGDLSVNAHGKFITVASGTSGEVFVFSSHVKKAKASTQIQFRCIGKLWTTVQLRDMHAGSSNSSATDLNNENPAQYGVPIMSLSDRWLAVMPPATSDRLSLNGTATLSTSNQRPPGINHHMAPPPPNESCGVEEVQETGFTDRFAREGTQVAVKSAKWAADKGMQAWRNYWNKQAPGDADAASAAAAGMDNNSPFPPTHGDNTAHSPNRNQSKMVSIFDLNRLLDCEETKNKNALVPTATFTPPNGVSFLSFSPSGLMLMTVSKNGDVQHVWNLMRMSHGRPRRSAKGVIAGPHVRQVARFTRMTVANVVDVAWSPPTDRRLAVVTEKGTVHMFAMPATAFQWPLPRVVRKASPQDPPSAEGDASRGRKGSTIGSAMQTLNGTARSFSGAIRTRSGSEGTKFPGFGGLTMTSITGARTGRAAALNFSKSLGTAASNAASNFRHAQDNKIHLPLGESTLRHNSIKWLTGRSRGSVAVVSGNVVTMHRIKVRRSKTPGRPARILKNQGVQFPLPNVRGGPFAPAIMAAMKPGEEAKPLEGFWSLRHTSKGKVGKKSSKVNPLYHAEVETNPPYLPFHMDPRVQMFFYANSPSNNIGESTEPGELRGLLDSKVARQPYELSDATTQKLRHPDPVEKLDSVPVFSRHPALDHGGHGGDFEGDSIINTAVENKVVKSRGGEDEEVQVIVTTRRRRRDEDGAFDEDGGLFEDDCEMIYYQEDQV